MKRLSLVLIIFVLFFLSFFKIITVSIFAQTENNEDIETIIPEQSLFCTDFPLLYSHEETNETNAANAPNEGEACALECKSAEIWLEKETKQPNFSFMKNRLQLVLPKMMPLQLNEKVDIDDKEKLKTRAKHFIFNESGCLAKEEKIPETEVALPNWWTALLGTTKIYCGLFGRCTPPEKLALRVEQPDLEELSEGLNEFMISECNKKDELIIGDQPDLSDIKKEFDFSPKVKTLVSFFEKLVNQVETTFASIRTVEEAELENRTRGALIGGKTLVDQSDFFSGFIIHEINSKIEKDPIRSEAQYEVSDFLNIENEEEAKKHYYQEQDQARIRSCLQICSLYPLDSKFDVSMIDPICTSCNPKDYQL